MVLWQSRTAAEADVRLDLLREGAALAAALRGVATVLHLAGPSRQGGGVHAELALAVLDAAQAAGVGQVFLASTAAVFGPVAGLASEEMPARPVSPYGAAKLGMERAAREWSSAAGPLAPQVCCLRIGNVAGADQLRGRPAGHGKVILDVFANGRGPLRSYIGPQALAAVLARLARRAAEARDLPDVVNVALPGGVLMETLLAADGRGWTARRAPKGAIPELVLDTTRLSSLVGLAEFPNSAEAILADLRTIVPAAAEGRG